MQELKLPHSTGLLKFNYVFTQVNSTRLQFPYASLRVHSFTSSLKVYVKPSLPYSGTYIESLLDKQNFTTNYRVISYPGVTIRKYGSTFYTIGIAMVINLITVQTEISGFTFRIHSI